MYLSSVATSLGIDIPQLVQCLSNVIRTPGSSHLSAHLFLVCNTLFLFLSPLHLVTKMISGANNYRQEEETKEGKKSFL